MFFKTLIAIVLVVSAFLAGNTIGFKDGQETTVNSQLSNIQRFNSTTNTAYAFVPLKSILEKDTENAVNILNNELISSIKLLTKHYDANDVNSSQEIIELITNITKWRNGSNINYNNVKELDEALNEFNKKHNKSFKS